MTPESRLTQLSNTVKSSSKQMNKATASDKATVADTGATGHFFEHQHQHNLIHTNIPLKKITAVKNGIKVVLPNNNTMQATHEALLDIPQLPEKARRTHLFPYLASGSLLSIGQLCDAGCTALFDKYKLYIFFNGKIILQGTRQKSKLWTMDQTTHHSVNAVIDAPTIAERIEFYSRSLFSPTLSTLAQAIKAGYLSSFPRITTKQLRRWPPNPTATVKGHMHAQRSNLRSTKQTSNNMTLTPLQRTTHVIDNDDHVAKPQSTMHTSTLHVIPSEEPTDATEQVPHPELPHLSENKETSLTEPEVFIESNGRTDFVYAACLTRTGKAFSDQTGKFPIVSSAGNKYLFILYDYDRSYITAVPIPSRTQFQLLNAYKTAIKLLQERGFKPKLQFMDNEVSKLLKEYMHKEHIDLQLTPAGLHRRNLAERAIQTYKNHLIAGFCSVDPTFPMKLWDKLLPQATITLNLLRASRVNPKLSAYAQIHGACDYTRTPLAPPGTKVLAHVRPEDRQSWSAHAMEGFYVGPAMDHYRCYRIYIKQTGQERIVQTLKWLPHDFKMPCPTREASIIAAANDLTAALLETEENQHIAPISQSTRYQLQQLSDIFKTKLPKSTPSHTSLKRTLRPNSTNMETSQKVPIRDDRREPRVPESAKKSPLSLTNELTIPTVKTKRIESTLVRDTHRQPRVPSTNKPITSLLKQVREQRPNTLATPPCPLPTVEPTTPTQEPVREQPTNSPSPPSKLPPKPPSYFYPNLTTAPIDCSIKSPKQPIAQPSPQIIPTNSHGQPLRRGKRNRIANKHLNDTYILNAVLNENSGQLEEYRHLIKGKHAKDWMRGNAKEIARLCQGRKDGSYKGTNTIKFIHPNSIPKGRTPTYLRVVATFRPTKEDPYRIRWTIGGNRVFYNGVKYTPNAEQTTVKILFNSVISTKGGKFMTIDLKDFYLNTVLQRKEYMLVPIKMIPDEIIEEYNLRPLIHNGNILAEVGKSMYGLPHAGRVSYDALVKHLAKGDYHPTKYTPGLFRHPTKPITFCLIVDDFGVKYTNRKDAEDLENHLQSKYETTTDWSGSSYCGVSLKWDYTARTVELSIPGYVQAALRRFNHTAPKRPVHSPHPFPPIKYGDKRQMATIETNTPLTPAERTWVQEFIGTFLYYARTIDTTMQTSVSSIGSAQSTANITDIKERINQFLNYAHTHPNAIIKYIASDMYLWAHSDSSYLCESKGRSRAGGHAFLSSKPSFPIHNDSKPPPTNAAILVVCKIIDAVMSSAQESETGAGFITARELAPIRETLKEMGHPQGPTPLQFDNKCATGILNDNVKQKMSKAMDMRFYWLRDRIRQGQFYVHWKNGYLNLADYVTKHHPTQHHINMRSTYVANAILRKRQTDINSQTNTLRQN